MVFFRYSFSINSVAIMDGPIKLFQNVQNFYHTMGIKSNQYFSLNAKKLFFLLFITLGGISVTAYFIFEAKTIEEYGNSFYSAISNLYTLVDFIVTVWRMPDILKLIEKCEKFIENSKCTRSI